MRKPNQLTLMQRFGWRLFFWDVFVIGLVLSIDGYVHFASVHEVMAKVSSGKQLTFSLSPIALAIGMFITWGLALLMLRAWNHRVAGTGIPEYLLTAKAGVAVVAALAFAALLFKVDVSRTFVLSAFFFGTAALIGHRWSARQWLHRQRRSGRYVNRTILVGPPEQLLEMVKRLKASPLEGYLPVVATVFKVSYTEELAKKFAALGVDLVIYQQETIAIVQERQIDSVIVVGSELISAERMKQIAWWLEGTGAELIVAPQLVDFAGSRISSHPVANMPFLHIETPKFEGFKFFLKAAFDFLLAIVVLVLSSPIFLLVAIAIWLEDHGPIFYAQERVGQNGRPFHMFKFRSMIIDADSRYAELRAKVQDPANKRMYKDPNDPRLTRVGKFIRRFSIDELPQIFNVLNGTMSMVGPRPPLAIEVAEYETNDHRRLLVKPGITGLWQVSGRALLSWDETVRLDLYYVENWSLLGDLLILLRTFKAVIGRSGAY